MKKIGILTFHNAYNYGAFLQCFALQEVLKDMEYNDVEIVDYLNDMICDSYSFFPKNNRNIKQKAKDYARFVLYGNKTKKRYEAFNDDVRKMLKISKKQYVYSEEIARIPENYNILIAGSDQIWNKKITGSLSDVYTLNFNNQNVKKISYAASIGDASLVERYKSEYKDKISKIDYISVREDDAKFELKKIIDKKINVVLDPTLLLNREEWNKKIENYKNGSEKYILAYVVQENEEYRKIVNYLSKVTGLRVIHFERRNKYDNVLKSAYTEGPLEFVNLIKNAEYVVATSFHATVFSIIFNKKFFIVPHKQTGSRVTNLLEKLKITDRVYYSLDDFKQVDYDFETDWENVEKILNRERQKSIDWLKNAIEG